METSSGGSTVQYRDLDVSMTDPDNTDLPKSCIAQIILTCPNREYGPYYTDLPKSCVLPIFY